MRFHGVLSVLTAAVVMTGCVTPGGGLVSSGTAATAVKGAAAGGAISNARDGLERCTVPLGTLAIDDERERDWTAIFGPKSKITTIEPLIRLAVLQSNCFVITSIGNSKTEAKLARITQHQRNNNEFRDNSRQHAGQRVAADYLLETDILMDSEKVGSIGGGMEAGMAGGLPGVLIGGIAGAIAGTMESRVSLVTLSVFDIRSGVQLAMAEGNSTAKNYDFAVKAFGGDAKGSLSGYSRTPEGKATVAAFMDGYNSMVIALRSYKMQQVEGGLGAGGALKVAE